MPRLASRLASTENLRKFIDMINFHKLNLEQHQDKGLTRGGHTFISYGDEHELNLMRHSTDVIVFESVPAHDTSVFDDSLRFTPDGHVQYSCSAYYDENDKRIDVRYVDRWTFYLCSTEEELFQTGTIHDMKDLTLQDIQELITLRDEFIALCDSTPPLK